MHASIKVSSKNQIVIPRAVRQRLNIKPGTYLHVRLTNEREVTLSTAPASVVEQARGAGTAAWKRSKVTPEEYMVALRQDWQ